MTSLTEEAKAMMNAVSSSTTEGSGTLINISKHTGMADVTVRIRRPGDLTQFLISVVSAIQEIGLGRSDLICTACVLREDYVGGSCLQKGKPEKVFEARGKG